MRHGRAPGESCVPQSLRRRRLARCSAQGGPQAEHRRDRASGQARARRSGRGASWVKSARAVQIQEVRQGMRVVDGESVATGRSPAVCTIEPSAGGPRYTRACGVSYAGSLRASSRARPRRGHATPSLCAWTWAPAEPGRVRGCPLRHVRSEPTRSGRLSPMHASWSRRRCEPCSAAPWAGPIARAVVPARSDVAQVRGAALARFLESTAVRSERAAPALCSQRARRRGPCRRPEAAGRTRCRARSSYQLRV